LQDKNWSTRLGEEAEERLPAEGAKGRQREIAFSFRVFGVFRGRFPGLLVS